MPAGFGVGLGWLGVSLELLPLLVGFLLPPVAGALLGLFAAGGGFLAAVEGSSVPVGGGLATLLAVGAGCSVCAGFGVGVGSTAAGVEATGVGAGAGAGLSAIANPTITAATAMPPPMKSPVLFFCCGAKSAPSGLPGDAAEANGAPPSGALSPPRGAIPSGAGASGAGAASGLFDTAGELACDASAFRSMSPESSRELDTLELVAGTAVLVFVVAVSADNENSTLDSLRIPVFALA